MESGQPHVEQQHVGPHLLDGRHDPQAVGDLAEHGMAFGFEHTAQPHADERVVVGENYGRHAARHNHLGVP